MKKHKISWEEEISERTFNDINISILKEFIKKANKAKRIDFKYTNVNDTLNKLGLIKGHKLLKATEVLFCDHNTLEIQAAVFAGTDKLTFPDIQLFKGNTFSLLKQSESYIKEHMNWRADLTPEGREEIPEVPLRAITEAIVNSLCHRDYVNHKGNEIAFFKNRIEIYNPGQFPEEHTPEDYIKGNEKSILRNPLIANTLYLSKDIEKWGSGLKRIYDACQEAKVKVEFENLKSGFLVTFYRPTTTEKVTERVSLTTGEKTREKIIKIIKENPKVTTDVLSKQVGISVKGIEWNINKLKKEKTLKRVGPDKGGYWEIMEPK